MHIITKKSRVQISLDPRTRQQIKKKKVYKLKYYNNTHITPI